MLNRHFLKNDYYREKENSFFSIHNPVGVKLLTHLRLQLSHLNEHKFSPMSCVHAK